MELMAHVDAPGKLTGQAVVQIERVGSWVRLVLPERMVLTIKRDELLAAVESDEEQA